MFKLTLAAQFLVAMESESRLCLASPEWMTVPFHRYPKEPFDELIDVLFLTQKCLKMADELRQVQGVPDTITRIELATDITDAYSKLEKWQKKHQEHVSLQTIRSLLRKYDNSSQSVSHHSLARYKETWLVPAVALIALVDVATMINGMLLHAIQGTCIVEQDDAAQGWDIIRASHLVKSIAGASKDMGPMMVLPSLKVASIWSSEEEVRKTAQIELELDPATKGALGSLAEQGTGFFASLATYIRRFGL